MNNEKDEQAKIQQERDNSHKEFEKSVSEYIKEGLAKGLSLEEIRQNIKRDVEAAANEVHRERTVH